MVYSGTPAFFARATAALADERRQKLLQTLVVWIIPALGAIVVHVVLWSERTPPPKRDKDFTPQEAGEGP